MSRKKYRTLWQHKFYLSSDNPQEKRLHDFLKDLAQDGEAAAWMVGVLIHAMPPEPKVQQKTIRARAESVEKA